MEDIANLLSALQLLVLIFKLLTIVCVALPCAVILFENLSANKAYGVPVN